MIRNSQTSGRRIEFKDSRVSKRSDKFPDSLIPKNRESKMVDRGIMDKTEVAALFVDPRIRSQTRINRSLLPPTFQPGAWDVICHTSKDSHQHVGNRRFKICITNHLHSYMKSISRSEKSAIISNIVSSIRESSTQQGGGFVKYDESSHRWYEVGDKAARDKAGQCLRELVRISREPTRKGHFSSTLKGPSTETKKIVDRSYPPIVPRTPKKQSRFPADYDIFETTEMCTKVSIIRPDFKMNEDSLRDTCPCLRESLDDAFFALVEPTPIALMQSNPYFPKF